MLNVKNQKIDNQKGNKSHHNPQVLGIIIWNISFCILLLVFTKILTMRCISDRRTSRLRTLTSQ